MAANRLELILSASTQALESGLKSAQDAIGKVKTEAEGLGESSTTAGDQLGSIARNDRIQALATAGEKISEISGKVGALADKFLEAGRELDDLKDTVGTFTGAGQVDAMTNSLRQMSVELGVPAKQLVDAQQRLELFGVTGTDMLQRVADAAAGSGKDIQQVGEVVAQFLSGNERAQMQLEKMLNIPPDALAEFGAVVDANNKVLMDTPAHAEAARVALEAMLDGQFAGKAKAMVDPVDVLDGKIQVLTQDIGENTLAVKNYLAEAMLPWLDTLSGMPDSMKAVVGIGTEVVGTVGGIAGQGLQAAAALKLLGVNSALAGTAMATAGNVGKMGMMALASPIGIAITLIGGLALGFHRYTQELESANQAAESLLQTEERRAAALRTHADHIGKSAGELKRIGVKSSELVDVIGGMQDQAQAARNVGNYAKERELVAQITAMQRVKTELAGMEQAERDAKERELVAQITAMQRVKTELAGMEQAERDAAEAKKASASTPSVAPVEVPSLQAYTAATNDATTAVRNLGAAKAQAAKSDDRPASKPASKPASRPASKPADKMADKPRRQEAITRGFGYSEAADAATTLRVEQDKTVASSSKIADNIERAATAMDTAAAPGKKSLADRMNALESPASANEIGGVDAFAASQAKLLGRDKSSRTQSTSPDANPHGRSPAGGVGGGDMSSGKLAEIAGLLSQLVAITSGIASSLGGAGRASRDPIKTDADMASYFSSRGIA